MKICIAGAGAIGTYLVGKLSRADVDVSVVARGATADAIRAYGVVLTDTAGAKITARPEVVEPSVAAPGPDWLFVCVKAYSVGELIASLKPLIWPETRLVFLQNGFQWWQAAQLDGGLDRLDPGRRIAAAVTMDQVVGGVTYANVANLGPGKAHHLGNDTVILGQPDGAVSELLQRLSEMLHTSGLDVRLTHQIQREVWLKLWGSLAFNPISTLTGATLDRVVGDEATRPVVTAMMREAQAVAGRLGVSFEISIDQRLQAAAGAGPFKTSMLQDFEAGRPLEVDAILGAVADAGDHVGVDTPAIDIVLGLLSQKIACRDDAKA